MNRVRLVIHGRVQGVGFRYFALRRAQDLGVTGTAGNRADGTVEVVAEGASGPLNEFVAALRTGPTNARVDRMDERWEEGAPLHRTFRID